MANVADNGRRQKRMAIGGAVLLVAALAIQGPKTLKMIRGSEPAAAPAIVDGAATPAQAPPATESTRAAVLQRPSRTTTDPFAPRGTHASTYITVGGAGDPGFKLVGDESIVGTERAVPGTVLTVVLRSLPISGGRAVASDAAEQFRAKGLRRVRVLRSGDYKSLRRGYYVVTAGRFATRGAALPTLAFARRTGAENPYVRLLRPE